MRSITSSMFLVAVAIAFVAASPYPLQYDAEAAEGDLNLAPLFTVDNHDKALAPQEIEHIRLKRATCDLLSPFNVGHAACALHCISIGRRGGWCDGRAVCNCRK